MSGGDGAHPVSDACDYARHCSSLDFFSINDHAVTLTPRRWSETIEAIRQCNDIAHDPSNPDLVAYLGWEWTQVGATPETHWGHKNVIVRGLEDHEIPTRPIAAGLPLGIESINSELPSAATMGLLGLLDAEGGGLEFAAYQSELVDVSDCERGVPVRELPDDCRESAATPGELFGKLDDWGFDSMVIPHGTTWGFYTPLGSSWDKQLTRQDHDPRYQRLIEVFSGHGNSEELRPFEEIAFDDEGNASCPEPANGYLPSCWRAGEIIAERCLEEGIAADECDERAAAARQLFVDAPNNGGTNVVPASTVAEWQDAGQCRDCFQPSFNYRPKLFRPVHHGARTRGWLGWPLPLRLRLHRRERQPLRAPWNGLQGSLPPRVHREPLRQLHADARRDEPRRARVRKRGRALRVRPGNRRAAFGLRGRAGRFLLPEWRPRGGPHDRTRSRFDLGRHAPQGGLRNERPSHPPLVRSAERPGRDPIPMGSQVEMDENPIFQVKAVGSFEQNPGCYQKSLTALGKERIERLCQGECYSPLTVRRPITRIEIVRIRPQRTAGEDIVGLVEDPWKVIPCDQDPQGCTGVFVDEDYARSGRDVLYYARAIEAPSDAVAADPLGCRRDENDRCVQVDPCFGRPDDDECLAQTEERAWSSPIFVNRPRTAVAAR